MAWPSHHCLQLVVCCCIACGVLAGHLPARQLYTVEITAHGSAQVHQSRSQPSSLPKSVSADTLEDYFDSLDQDADDIVTLKEYLHIHPGMNRSLVKKVFRRMDANRDGVASRDEFVRFGSERHRRPPAAIRHERHAKRGHRKSDHEAAQASGHIVWKNHTYVGPHKIIGGHDFRLPYAADAVDMDGDGQLDVLTASFEDGKVAWCANNGHAKFDCKHLISSALPGAYWPVAADVDNDGIMDVVVVSQLGNKADCFFGTGRGLFKEVLRIQATDIHRVIPGDLDGDGDKDFLVLIAEKHQISWYEFVDRSTLGPEHPIGVSHKEHHSVRIVDIDRDGDNDVLFVMLADGYVWWHENLGFGKFKEAKPLLAVDGGKGLVYSMEPADLNGDGVDDLLVLTVSGINRYINSGNGTFAFDGALYPSFDEVAYAARTADLDQDGLVDVIAASSARIFWYRNLASGSFASPETLCWTSQHAWMFIVADLDGDRDLDLLLATPTNDAVVWYESLASARG